MLDNKAKMAVNKRENRDNKDKTCARPFYKKTGRKKPKKITSTYLHNAGLYYLERFAASKTHFKDIMVRKIKRSCSYYEEQDYASCIEMLDALIQKFEDCGLLDDKSYASAQISSLRRKGLSRKAIHIKLRNKGISAELTEQILTFLDEQNFEDLENAEFFAALTLARKKKIGPYVIGEKQNTQKSLGILARAGFSYNTAHKIMALSPEELKSLS